MQVGAQKATQSRSNSEGTKPMKNAMNIQGTGNTIVQFTPGRDLAVAAADKRTFSGTRSDLRFLVCGTQTTVPIRLVFSASHCTTTTRRR